MPQPCVCFFVLCNLHWFNRVPGLGESQAGDCLSALHPYSDAGCADLPLTLLGAPVNIRNIGETRARSVGLPRSWGLPSLLALPFRRSQRAPERSAKARTSAGRGFGRTAGVGAGGAATYNSSRTGPHVAVGHHRGSDAIHSNRSPWGIGSDVRLVNCTSSPTSI